MADGTVRGGFDLDTTGAVRGLHSIRDAGREVDATLVRAGQRMDTFANSTQRATMRAGNAWGDLRRRMDSEVRAIELRLDGLEGKLDRFGSKSVSAHVELSGFDVVNAQLSQLEARLDRLGARSVTSRVGVSGGGGFMGGGGNVSPPGGMVAGGRGSPLFSSLGGFAGRLPWWAMIAPLVPQLLGGATALVGSAGSAALGAGAVGAGALGSLGVGGLGAFAVAKPALSGLTETIKAQQAYNQALAEFGRQSSQATTAKRKLDYAMMQHPGSGGAAIQIGLLRSGFTSGTAPGRRAIYSSISQAAYNVRGALPTLTRNSNLAAGAAGGGLVQASQFLTSPQSLSQMTQLTHSFAREMPTMVGTVDNLARTFGNLAVAAIPFFHEADQWVNRWTQGLSRSTSDTAKVRGEMQGMVNSAKDWARLLGAGGRVLRDLFSAGVPAGDSMVGQFTHTLDRWDVWLQRNPDKVRSFMRDSEQGVSKIATVIGNLSRDVWQIFRAVDPILSRAESFLKFASGLGGGGLLSGLGLLYGGYNGARGALGGRGPSGTALASSFILGRPAGVVGARGGGGVLVGGGAAAGALGGGSRGFLMPRVSAGFPTLGNPVPAGALGGELPLLAAIAGSRFAGTMSGFGGPATPEAFQARIAELRARSGLPLEGARYALPISEAGLVPLSERSGLAGLAGKAGLATRGAAAGAARVVLPLAAIQSLLTGLNTGGGVPHAVAAGVSSGLSTLTLGMVSPTSFNRVLHAGFGTDNAGASIAGQRGFMQSVANQAGAVRTPAQLRALQTRVQGVRLQYEMSPEDSAKLTAFLRHASQVAATNAGAGASNTWESAFEHGVARMGTNRAVNTMLAGMTRQIRSLGPQGSRAFAGDTAQWASQMMEDNPKMRRPLERLMQGIISDLNKVSHHTGTTMQDIQNKIFYFNGQILKGSTTTWGHIRDSLVNPSSVALEKLTGIWGQINSEAVTALTQMGFSRQQAGAIVRGTAQGGKNAANAGVAVNARSAGFPAATPLTTTAPPGLKGSGPKHARGGAIGGQGLLDTVPTPDGGMAAPGEAWIANRHSMNTLSRATLAKYGKTAWQIIRDETRMHSAPPEGFQRGGSIGAALARGASGWVARQHPELHPGIAAAAQAVLSRFPMTITATTNGSHVPNSYHYKGEAIDIAGDTSTMFRASDWIRGNIAGGLTEGIHNPNLAVKNGQVETPPGVFGAVWAGHANHIHMAVAGAFQAGVAAAGGAGGAGAIGGGFGGQSIRLRAPRTGLPGIPGAMGDHVSQIWARAMQQHVNSQIGGGGATSLTGFTGGGTSGANQALGRRMMLAAGWGPSEWPSLQALWTRESGWNSNAVNPSSGAAGIPQALGHGSVFPLGQAAPQIAWGLNYIRGRYGSPSAAWAHEQSSGWYQRGGQVDWAGWNNKGGSFITNGATVFGAGEKRRERVDITPLGHGGSGRRNITVNFNGPVNLGSKQDAEELGKLVAGKILDALDGSGTDSALAGVSN